MEDKDKLTVLLEMFKSLNEESKTLLGEMIQSTVYRAIVISAAYGIGAAGSQSTSPGK
jgi:hypothetical protein